MLTLTHFPLIHSMLLLFFVFLYQVGLSWGFVCLTRTSRGGAGSPPSSSSQLHMVAKTPHKQHRLDRYFDVKTEEMEELTAGALPEESPLALELGKSLENSPCLVLNADYTPLSFIPLSLWNWKDSLRAVLSEKATVVSSYNLEIRSVYTKVLIPSVIALKRYHAFPNQKPVMTRRNVYIRDSFQCQYCQECFGADDLTLDHVLPRSKGGKLTWTNTVTACSPCNYRKGHTLLEDLPQLGMRIKTMPKAPNYYELQTKARM